jgi:hypothetical protein
MRSSIIVALHRILSGCQDDQVMEVEMGDGCSMYGRNAFRILVGKAEGKRPLRRLRH